MTAVATRLVRLVLAGFVAAALVGVGSASATTTRVDDSGTVLSQGVVPMRWKQLVPGRGADHSVEASVRVALRLNLARWVNQPVRLYMALAPVVSDAVHASWRTQGRLLPGALRSGSRVLVFEGVPHAALLEETLDLIRVSLPDTIELDAKLSARRTAVIADPTHIHQVIMNLCRNAEHAMPAGGRLTVALDVIDANEDAALSHGLLPAGRYIRLRVEDTGCGMTAEVAARIFEPFFTTRDAGAGTGLGLALVQGIAADLGGAIDVASQPGQGSTFDLYLPRSDAEAIAKADHAAPLPRGSGERVLLVEDEKPLMLLTEEMLAALNYEPAGFTRPSEALEEFRADPTRFDAVVLDQLMPGMTGTELARQMRQLRADVPVVLISGYTGPVLTQQALSAGIDHILTKPLDLRQIAEALSKVLARESVG